MAPIRATQPTNPKPVAVRREVASEVLVVAAREALVDAAGVVLTARDCVATAPARVEVMRLNESMA